MQIPKLIKIKRLLLQEGQATFGKRFGVSRSAVSLWESGDREAGYKVIEFVLMDDWVECDKCKGKGCYKVENVSN